MSQVLTFGVVTIAAVATSAAAAPVAARLGWRWRAIDHPGYRKQHDGPVPRTGGLAIAVGLLAGLLAGAVLGLFPVADHGPRTAVFGAATALIFTVGLVDDLRGCSVGVKLAAQIVAALLVVGAGSSVASLVLPPSGPLEFGFAGHAAAVLWLVGVTNAVNFMDGLDGLAGGIAAIVAASLAVLASLLGVPALFVVAAAVCGACLGFLPFNWHPARIFLGDSGSQTVGFVLACLALTVSFESGAVLAALAPLLALGVPVIDALIVVLTRLGERAPGRSVWKRLARMFQADRLHLHHHGLDAFHRHRFVVLLEYATVVCACLLATGAALRGNPNLAAAALVVEVAAVAAIRLAGMRARARWTKHEPFPAVRTVAMKVRAMLKVVFPS